MWRVAEIDSGVVVARFDRPPMNYYSDEDIGQLEELAPMATLLAGLDD